MSVFRDGAVTVAISSDKLKGMLSISAPAEDYPSTERVLTSLRRAGIKFGIDKTTISAICEDKIQINDVVVAEGSVANEGEPTHLDWKIDINGVRPKISSDGRADLKNLSHFESVEPGTVLATKVMARGSTKGVLVTGEVVEPPVEVEEIPMPVGKNVSVSEDGMSLISDISGVASLKFGLVNVDTAYHVHGDVDMKTGNINYDGAVMIDGDVRSGFRVEAAESIYINGTVEGAEVYSRNGSIIIRRGVLGRNRARILARDELRCGFIQDAHASARNDITIEHYALGSELTSGGVIRLVQNEGLLRGGKLVADLGIEVLEAGSQRNTPTELVLSRSGKSSSSAKRHKLQSELTEHEQGIVALNRRRQFLELLKKQLNTLSEARRLELSNINSQINEKIRACKKINNALSEFGEEGSDNKQSYTILVRNKLYRKVIFTIGYKQYINETVRGGVTVRHKGDKLHLSPLS